MSATNTPICPCDGFVHPRVIFNPPGRNVLAYRAGDYLTFRHALLLSRPDEVELKNWHPSAKGDLALQMLEWWAYLADILTFYNERIANQSYLRTADLPESVQRLIRILGYRPCPGIGARGTIAALMSKPTPFTLPQGFPIQSKPGPGKQPQIFELDAKTLISFSDPIALDLVTTPTSLKGKSAVLLKGAVTTVKVDDELLLLEKKNGSNYTLTKVSDVKQVKDPQGKINTQVIFSDTLTTLPDQAQATDYRLLKSVQSAHVWQYADPGIAFTAGPPPVTPSAMPIIQHLFSSDVSISNVHLDSITRQIKVGDPILFEDLSGTKQPQLTNITHYSEVIWYANPKRTSTPWEAPDPDTKKPPVPIPHTRLSFQPVRTITTSPWRESTTLVRYAWQDVGQLIDAPSSTISGTSIAASPLSPVASIADKTLSVLLEDVNDRGVSASATVNIDASSLQLTDLPNPPVTLTQPLQVLCNLLLVSRGKTVPNEILGSGDATIAGQEFVLQKSPLTYLPSGDSISDQSYKSTLRVWVNNIEWQEVASFYNQLVDAHIFVTREDENNMTHVQFGDGINGARLPSGVNNVVACYRYGSGADAPEAGQLTVITQPWPNLKAIRNPVAVSGGANPDLPKQIRCYAPRSVLTFGRAVSGDDYETIAAQARGVARARSYWIWNAEQQRTLVTI